MIVELDRGGGVGALLTRALDLPEDAAEGEVLAARLAAPPPGRVVVRIGSDGGDGVAFGSVSANDPRLGYVELLAVEPRARRRGMGAALLRGVEERLAALGVRRVRIGGNPPCYAWPGVDVRYTAAVCLARRAGYRMTDTAWNMTAPLHEPGGEGRDGDEARLAAQGVTIVEGEAAGGAGVAGWVRSIWGDGWAWEVEQSLGRDGAGCHVAVRDGQILGFAAFGANRPSWFGPMGTAPAAEGLGVGRVLLRRCLADQKALGLRSAQIGWAGPIGFYSKAVGARIERVFWIFEKSLTAAGGDTPAGA